MATDPKIKYHRPYFYKMGMFDIETIQQGVRQRCILSTDLYKLFVNGVFVQLEISA